MRYFVGSSRPLCKPNCIRLFEFLNIAIGYFSRAPCSRVIQSSGQRLANLVTNLLDQSLLNKKKLEVHLDREVDFSKIASEVVALSKSSAVDGVSVLSKVPQNLPIFLGDPARLTQIVTNLVNNALKFTSVGHVDILANTSKGMVHISVEDTGIGIKEEDQEMIFETLKQVDGSVSMINE